MPYPAFMLTPNSSSRDTTAIHKIQNVFPVTILLKLYIFISKKSINNNHYQIYFLKILFVIEKKEFFHMARHHNKQSLLTYIN